MDFKTIFSPSYWFTVESANFSDTVLYAFLAFFVALVIAGIVVRARRGNKKKDPIRARVFGHVARLLTTMGLLGVLLLFFSFENIRLLGARFWYVLWDIVTIVWVIWIVRYARREMPAQHMRGAERDQREKYLPKPKDR